MDNFKHTQMATYLYLKNIREMLEYSTNGRNKTKEDYDTKKKIFEQAITEKGLLTEIVIKNNPDQAEKIKETYEDFMFDVFNDRVITFEDGKMIFDVAMKMNYFKSLFQVRELFNSISWSQIQFAKNNRKDNYDSSVEELLIKEDVLYRSVFMLVLHTAIRDSFMEFVTEMNASKGNANPQTNFITNILSQYMQMLAGIMDNNKSITDPDFNEAKHRMKTTIDAITGKLGKKNLQDQENYFVAAREAIDKALVKLERVWHEAYTPLIKETIEFEKSLRQN
ncbi:MAG: hypothetical protein J1F31_05855 [Erysipelotrichales bacterium]|nr:hypothetical protein [Erysipelotrichales bacterium]